LPPGLIIGRTITLTIARNISGPVWKKLCDSKLLKFQIFILGFLPSLAIISAKYAGVWIFTCYHEPKRALVQIVAWFLIAWVLTLSLSEKSLYERLKIHACGLPAIFLGLFTLWCGITLLWAPVLQAGLYEISQYATLAAVFPVLTLLFSLDRFKLIYLWGIAISWLVVAGAGILQLKFSLGPLLGIGGINGSFFGASNAAALGISSHIFLLFGLIAVCFSRRKFIAALFLGAVAVLEIIYLTTLGSRTSYAATGVGLLAVIIFFAARNFRAGHHGMRVIKPFAAILAVVLIMAAVFTMHPYANKRLQMAWKYIANPLAYLDSERWVFLRNSIYMVQKKPAGVGMGNWGVAYPLFRKTGPQVFFNEKVQVRRAHCDYAQILAETGYLGLILWLGIVIAAIKKTWEAKVSGDNQQLKFFVLIQLAVFLLLMFSDYPLQMPYHKFLFFSLLALGVSLDEKTA